MTNEQLMVLFEANCANWWLDFSKNTDSLHGLTYSSYETGVMFGMFSKGFDSAFEYLKSTNTIITNEKINNKY